MRWSLKLGNTVLNSREGSSDERNLHEFGKEVGLEDQDRHTSEYWYQSLLLCIEDVNKAKRYVSQ